MAKPVRADRVTPSCLTLAGMRIAAVSREDLKAIAAVHVATWQTAYAGILPSEYLANLSVEHREVSWRQVLAEARSELLVAFQGSAVVAFASFGNSRDADAPGARGEVSAIYVIPSAWSTGVGRALWCAVRERLIALGCRFEVYGGEPPSYTARACERRVLSLVPTHVRSNQCIST
jgi:GNAT superfamily N-acetyltransferase